MTLWRRIYVERKKVVLPLLVFLIANVAVLALGVVPLRKIVSNSEQAKLDATVKLRDARLLEKRAKDQRTGKERADEELKKFYNEILPVNLESANELRFWLQTTATASSLQYKRNTLNPLDDVKESTLMKYKFSITLIGDYPNIRKFLYAVETAQQFLIIERVALAPANETVANNGKLEVTLDVSTYYQGDGGRGR